MDEEYETPTHVFLRRDENVNGKNTLFLYEEQVRGGVRYTREDITDSMVAQIKKLEELLYFAREAIDRASDHGFDRAEIDGEWYDAWEIKEREED